MTATREPHATKPTVTQIDPPTDAQGLSTLPRIDYADAFRVNVDVHVTPEQWVRGMLQDAPARVRARLVLGWTALGLRLGPPWSPERALGWKVTHSDAAFVLLAADSWLGLRGRLLLRREPDGLLFATFVQLGNPAVRRLWAAITPHHQHVVRSLLTHAVVRRPPERR
jgi:hypothetical protein